MAYTNAATIVSEDFRDTEDLDGLFSGFDPETAHLRPGQLAVRRATRTTATSARHARTQRETAAGLQHESHGAAGAAAAPSGTRRCSTRAASTRSSSGTSPATPRRWSSGSAACRRRSSWRCARAWTANSGRERTTALVYSVGWTQHSVGVQYIRTGAIIQLLLGNMGRPGRRHHGAARARQHPGLHRHPDAVQPAARLPADAAPRRSTRPSTSGSTASAHPGQKGFWANAGAYARQPAQGVLGRRGDRRERLLLRLPAPADRRPRHLPAGART